MILYSRAPHRRRRIPAVRAFSGASPDAEDNFASGDGSYSVANYWDWGSGQDVVTAASMSLTNPDEGSYVQRLNIPGNPNYDGGHNNELRYNFNGGTLTEWWLEMKVHYPSHYWRTAQNLAIGGEGSSDGSIDADDAVLTCTGASFDDYDIGKWVYVNGAGVAGAQLVAYITSVTSSTVVTLSADAGTTVTGATWGRKITGWPNWKWFVAYGGQYASTDRPRIVMEEVPSYNDPGNAWLRLASGPSNGWTTHGAHENYVHESDATSWATAHADKKHLFGTGAGHLELGAWSTMRFYHNIGTVGGVNADGTFKLWLNGGLVCNWQDVPFMHESQYAGADYPHWTAGYMFGAANDPSPIAQSVAMSGIRLYTNDPGW